MIKTAAISPDGKYRYALTREWDEGKRPCVFVMLNPSTADANVDDPTIRRCIDFAKRWDFGTLTVVNLFAVRATKPEDMLAASDPVGPENHTYCQRIFDRVNVHDGIVVCAWGAHGTYMDMDRTMLGWIDNEDIVPLALKVTKSGQPGHPLYLPKHLAPTIYPGRK